MFNEIFSQILGGLGGAAAGGGQGINPFSDITGMMSNIIGGPASESGTLFSLPGEMLTGIADLGTSKNILGDIAGLGKPVMSLGDKALGGLGGDILSSLNPFGTGPDSSPLGAALRALMPIGAIAGLSAAAAGLNRRQYGEEALP